MVCPATDNHVKKYQRQETFLVEETDADYRTITLPYIEKHCLSVQVRVSVRTISMFVFVRHDLGIYATSRSPRQWVCNILEKKAEVERIVYEDPDPEVGFILLPDFKWDQRQVTDKRLLAVTKRAS